MKLIYKIYFLIEHVKEKKKKVTDIYYFVINISRLY